MFAIASAQLYQPRARLAAACHSAQRPPHTPAAQTCSSNKSKSTAASSVCVARIGREHIIVSSSRVHFLRARPARSTVLALVLEEICRAFLVVLPRTHSLPTFDDFNYSTLRALITVAHTPPCSPRGWGAPQAGAPQRSPSAGRAARSLARSLAIVSLVARHNVPV